MTKKDFEFWADFIRQLSPDYDMAYTFVYSRSYRFKITNRHHLAYLMAKKFAKENCLFSAQRFYNACGFEDKAIECLRAKKIQD